jgi:hypothetical protein
MRSPGGTTTINNRGSFLIGETGFFSAWRIELVSPPGVLFYASLSGSKD